MEKMVLLDMYALVYRAYYAFLKSPRYTSRGLNTSAIMGFMNTLHDVLRREAPTFLAVAKDKGPSFRHTLFPPYKAQRAAQPEDITRAIPYIEALLAALHIPCLYASGYEADDVLATLARRAAEQGVPTYILTADKDLAQIVDDSTFLCRPRHMGSYEILDTRAVCAQYDIAAPRQVVDLLALMGDSADNYTGCPGVGAKTATQLLRQFGSIDEILAHTQAIPGKLGAKIEENRDNILLARQLAEIKSDVPLAIALAEMRLRPADGDKLRTLFAELEMPATAKKFLAEDTTTTEGLFAATTAPRAGEGTTGEQGDYAGDLFAASTVSSATSTGATGHCHYVSAASEQQEIVRRLQKESTVSIAVNTSVGTPRTATLYGIALAGDDGEAYYFPLSGEGIDGTETRQYLAALLGDTALTKIGHDIKGMIMVLARGGITLAPPLWDTMIAHYVVQPESTHSIAALAESLLHISLPPLPTGPSPDAGDSVGVYAVAQWRLYEALAERLTATASARLFTEIEMPLVPVLAAMEKHGIRLDTPALETVAALFAQRQRALEEQIYQLAGHTFNLSSPRQVGTVLFDEMKIVAKAKKTKSGQYSTSEEELQKIASRHAIIPLILAQRALRKLIGTYVETLPQLVDKETHHLHTTFHQAVTATGRLSSSSPNLQNIPIRGEDGKEIRRCFLPDDGELFLSADYSQIELRVLAHLSADDNLCRLFHDGNDIHAATAAAIYHKPLEEVTREERTAAKRANFGIIYGITGWGLAEQLNIERQAAQRLIDDYFAAFPKVQEYIATTIAQARERGYTETLYHRRRYLPDITSANSTVRAVAERTAINAPIQGTAADIIKIAMVSIHRALQHAHLKAALLLSVHDEVTFSVPPEEQQQVEEIVRREMEGACALRVPLVVEMGWGNNWLEAH